MADAFGSYRLELEAVLTWFPTSSSAALKEVRMRGTTLVRSSRDDVFIAGNQIIHNMGQTGPEDLLAPNGSVVGFIKIGVNQDDDFEVEYELVAGASRRSKRIRIPPDTRTPFMIHLAGAGNDDALAGTAAVLQGVIVATQPIGVGRVSVLASEIFKAFSRVR
jgi:hypothetical protein